MTDTLGTRTTLEKSVYRISDDLRFPRLQDYINPKKGIYIPYEPETVISILPGPTSSSIGVCNAVRNPHTSRFQPLLLLLLYVWYLSSHLASCSCFRDTKTKFRPFTMDAPALKRTAFQIAWTLPASSQIGILSLACQTFIPSSALCCSVVQLHCL